MRLVDTHCHLDLYPDYRRVIEETRLAGIEVIAVTNAPSVFRRCAALTRHCPAIHPALGLHPELVVERGRELDLLLGLLDETRFVGEVGLDFVTGDPAGRTEQRRVFAAILERCADYGDKVLTVHSRRAAAEAVAMIGAAYPGTVILHWFSGPGRVLADAAAGGCYFSVNPAMLASPAGRRVVAAIPRDRLLTETDGPFVAVEGAAARPRHIALVVDGVARLWGIGPIVAAEILHRNARQALGAP